MNANLFCPACHLPVGPPVDPSASAHRTSTGHVSYLRCACGKWLVGLGGRVVGSAGTSDFADLCALNQPDRK